MVLAHSDSSGARWWAAAKRDDAGRILTRDQAEGLAQRVGRQTRFLLPYSAHAEQFAQDPAPLTMGTLPGETIWNYGEPTWTDMRAVLQHVAGLPPPAAAHRHRTQTRRRSQSSP